MTGKLFYGDNLDVLREHVPSESVDLVYLDPPFNSNANYNILFKSKTGDGSDAQIEAFEDTWHWNDKAEDAFDQVMRSGNTDAAELLRAMRGFLGQNDMMAYLAMMAIRLLELHRVLKPTGSLYLHCDPTASHYLKLLLDGVFGADRFKTEIIWKRTSAHSNVYSSYGDVTDIIFFYTKTASYTWNQLYRTQTVADVEAAFPNVDPDGRRWRSENLRNPGVRPNLHYPYLAGNGVTYHPHPNGWTVTQAKMQEFEQAGKLHFPNSPTGRLRRKYYSDETPGIKLQNLWDDISAIGAQAQERLGYPTQKPLALLERIIAASSNEGDTILDPFCGCGTAVHAAEKLGRNWIGIDITHLAISLIEKRLRDAFPGVAFSVEGTPKDKESALDLAARDKYQFQWWACSMVDAYPYGGKKKGADGGIDGIIYFKPDGRRTEKAIVSVKGGETKSVAFVEQLAATVERERAQAGILIMIPLPTREMESRAAAVGRFESEATGKTYAKLQIITLAELFGGKRPDLPYVDVASVKRAKREDTGRQERLI